MTIAPFFGIRWDGCARWLNRILVLAEVALGIFVVTMQIIDPIVDKKWFLYLLIAVWYLGVSVINGILHKLNCILVALYYGTTDPHLIVMKIKEREKRRKRIKRQFEEEGIPIAREIDL